MMYRYHKQLILNRNLISCIVKGLAIIKAKKRSIDFEQDKILQIFNIKTASLKSDKQKMQKYMEKLGSTDGGQALRKIRPSQFLELNSKINIVKYTKYCIGDCFQKLTPTAQMVIDNFFNYLLHAIQVVLLQERENGLNQVHSLHKDLVQCCDAVAQFYYLTSKTLENCMIFMKIANSYQKIISYNAFLFFYRITLDTLKEYPIQNFSYGKIIQILKFMAINQTNVKYYRQSSQLIRHFWQPIKDIWVTDFYARKHVLQALKKLLFYSERILQQIQEIYFSKNNLIDVEDFTNCVYLLVSLNRINSKNFKNYENRFKQVIDKIGWSKKRHFFNYTFSILCMAGVWSQTYWLSFLQFLQSDRTNSVQLYKIYVLSQVLKISEKQIPKQIKQKSGILQKILLKQPDFKGEVMVQDFRQKHSRKQRNIDCQSQLANSLRLNNSNNVRTEELIEFFVVDIIVNKKVIIEVNGSTHFIMDIQNVQNNQVYNLKSRFRTSVLAELGYFVIDVSLHLYSEGSFNILQKINRFIRNPDSEQFTNNQDQGLKFTYPKNYTPKKPTLTLQSGIKSATQVSHREGEEKQETTLDRLDRKTEKK